MCWLAVFWVFVLRAFLSPKQKIVGIFSAPNCDLEGLVPPFWHLWELFWRLGGTLGDLGSSRKDNGDPGLQFYRFWHGFGIPFRQLFGHRGLEILCCFGVRFHVSFATDFWVDIRALGAAKQGFRMEDIAKISCSQKSAF